MTLRISPANPNIVVGQVAQFIAIDSIGRVRDDALWTLNGSIATLETEPVVNLTAESPGVVTLSATVGGVTTETQVTIVGESVTVAGQSLWSAPSGTGLPVTQVVQAAPTASGPDLYVISGDASRTFIQALGLDGRQMWQSWVPAGVNKNSAPDGLGGLIITLHNTCDNVNRMRIIALDGATGAWRWEVESSSTCTVEAPQLAIRQDQAVVVASPGNTSGLPGLMVLNGTASSRK